MKSVSIIFSTLLLTGCFATNKPIPPQIPKWPDVNQALMEKCPDLKTVPPDNKEVSKILETVSDNYKEYYECQAKVNDWIFWYTEQKKNWGTAK